MPNSQDDTTPLAPSIPDISTISGIGDYSTREEQISRDPKAPAKSRTLYLKGDKAFLVINPTTVELRTDPKLSSLLREKYESVMQSRYFGRGGIEIVLAGTQFTAVELADLIRLSYNLTKDLLSP